MTPAYGVSQAGIRVLAGAAVISRCDYGRILVQLTYVAVGRFQVLAGCWLQISVPCLVGLSMGPPQHDSWLLSEQVSRERARERESTQNKAASFYNPVLEVTSHYFC